MYGGDKHGSAGIGAQLQRRTFQQQEDSLPGCEFAVRTVSLEAGDLFWPIDQVGTVLLGELQKCLPEISCGYVNPSRWVGHCVGRHGNRTSDSDKCGAEGHAFQHRWSPRKDCCYVVSSGRRSGSRNPSKIFSLEAI